MKIRLFLAALFLFLLPLCFTSSNQASSQFSVYACSGYSVATGLCCECEEEGCVCGDALRIDPNDNQATSSNNPINSGSEILFAIAATMLIWRLRA
jgi:hypothetical protein